MSDSIKALAKPVRCVRCLATSLVFCDIEHNDSSGASNLSIPLLRAMIATLEMSIKGEFNG